MIYYYAVLAGYPEVAKKLDSPNILTSYVKKPNLAKIKSYGVNKVFLDSGAFTAFNTGKPINLKEYINFCQENKGYEVYAGLDVMNNPIASAKNFDVMTKEGVNILPAFHVGSDYKYLYNLMDKYEYIAIGGVAFRQSSGEINKKAIMRAMIKIHKSAKVNNTRLHGFGITNWNLVTPFDWYSVDSSVYLIGTKFGSTLVFEKGKLYQPIKTTQQAIMRRHYLDKIIKKQGFKFYDLYQNPDKKQQDFNKLLFNCISLQNAFKWINKRNVHNN